MSLDFEDEPKRKLKISAPAQGRSLLGSMRMQHMMFAVGVIAVLIWLGQMAGLWLLVGMIVFGIVATIALAVIFAGRGSSQRDSVLWALAVAAERELPLGPAALAFSDQFGRGFRWRTELLANLLHDGEDLPSAMEQVPGLVNPDALLLVRAGWETKQLGPGLRLAAGLRQARKEAWGSLASRFMYLGLVCLSMQSMVGFVMYFIVPKYEAIFKDFGITLPYVTRWTIEMSHRLFGFYGIPLWVGLAIELVVLVGFPLSFFNLSTLNIPVFDALFRRKHSALVMRVLSLWVEGRQPIEEGLKSLAHDYPSWLIRNRLERVIVLVRGGTDWVEAMENHGLLRNADASVLRSARRVGNLTWALKEMSESNERRLGYRLQVLLQLLFPAMVLLLGAATMLFAVAYFSPLVKLIEVLS